MSEKGNTATIELPLEEKTCPLTFDELFEMDPKDAQKAVARWMDENGDPEKDDEVMQRVINKYQKYFYCKGVFESDVANFSVRVGHPDDGNKIKGMKIKFEAGRPIVSPVRKRHKNGHYMTTGSLDLELICAVQDDQHAGIIRNIATDFASKSERIIPSDFIPGNENSMNKLTLKQKDFIKLCKGVKFHRAYMNASQADRKRIAKIAKRIFIEALLNNTNYSHEGEAKKPGGCFWLSPPMTEAYARKARLEKELEETHRELEAFEGALK